MAYEDDLTALISDIFDWLETKDKRILQYDSISLRGALERYFYFGGIRNPQNLQPLLLAAEMWRALANTQLLRIYDDLYARIKKPSLLNKARSKLYSVLQVLELLISGFSKSDTAKSDTASRPIAFFAYADRFIFFYRDFLDRLDKEQCVLIAFKGMVDPAKVASTGAVMAQLQVDSLQWAKMHMNLRHPLFPAYLVAVKSYLIAYGTLRHHRPKVVLFAEGTSMADEVMVRAARGLGIPTIRIQSGRAGILHSGYRNMCFDKMLCWGPGFVERFRQHSPDPEYVITGSPLLDSVSQLQRIENGARLWTFTIFTQPVSTYISSDHYRQLVRLAEQIITVEQGCLVVRKHPADKATDFDELASRYPNEIRMMGAEDHSLAETLAVSAAAIGFYSTTLSEAAAYGVVPIILKLREQHSVFPYPEKYGAAIVAQDNAEALHWVKRIMHQSEELNKIRKNMENFADEFFGPRDGQAMTRIIDCILEEVH